MHLGLTSAALLSKAGLKVLVLEKHDKCGGGSHTFKVVGYEFDVGIHYVGGFTRYTFYQTLLDQISDGQIRWAELGKHKFPTYRHWKIFIFNVLFNVYQITISNV